MLPPFALSSGRVWRTRIEEQPQRFLSKVTKPPIKELFVDIQERRRHSWLLADNLGGEGRQAAVLTGTNSRSFYVEQKPGSLLFPLSLHSLELEEWPRAGAL